MSDEDKEIEELFNRSKNS